MKFIRINPNPARGFMAMIIVMLLASSTLLFSLITMSSAADYADGVQKRQLRIQARLNTEACLDTLVLMTAKDYFISGSFFLKEFACNAEISNDFAGQVNIILEATLGSVSAKGKCWIKTTDESVAIVSKEIY